MSYQSRIRDIHSSFVMGFQDRETCFSLFEQLLHDYGLLPNEVQLDPAITDDSFLALLKAAKGYNGAVGDPAPRLEKPDALARRTEEDDDLSKAGENLRKFTRWLEQIVGDMNLDAIAETVKQFCPVCKNPASALFNRVQSFDQQMLPVDPPRCRECMTKWVGERFSAANIPAVTDGSPVSPLSNEETSWFEFYEKEME